MEPLELAVASPELQDRLQALDVRSCLGCGACASGCPIPGTPGMEGFDPWVAVRLLAMGREAEAAASPFPWVCTSCGRCSHVCPMGIDLTAVFSLLRGLVPRANVPGTLEKGVASVLETGNTLAIPLEDLLDTLSEIGGELAEEKCRVFLRLSAGAHRFGPPATRSDPQCRADLRVARRLQTRPGTGTPFR